MKFLNLLEIATKHNLDDSKFTNQILKLLCELTCNKDNRIYIHNNSNNSFYSTLNNNFTLQGAQGSIVVSAISRITNLIAENILSNIVIIDKLNGLEQYLRKVKPTALICQVLI